ncbi:MAG TPA: type II toxin-antitoxin system VapC family toxin [Pirellulales bacterium]|nr:type II toxin-antitoxin system VapC family toxin [Pirellulales bacterium]
MHPWPSNGFFPSRIHPKALGLRDDVRNKVHDLHAPDTFPIEVAHALTRAERRGLLRPSEAMPKVVDVLSTGPNLHSYLLLLPRAVELSSTMRIGVYDCLYVALAEREQCRVVSADKRLVNVFPSIVVSLDFL